MKVVIVYLNNIKSKIKLGIDIYKQNDAIINLD